MANLPRERPRRKPRLRKIEGVTITPTWKWSKWYMVHVEAPKREPPPFSRKDRHESKAKLYASWLASRDGIDLSAANKAICRWDYREFGKPTVPHCTTVNGKLVMALRRKTRPTFIESVEFYYEAPHQRGQWYAGGRWKGEPIEREHVATIDIPYFDFQPTVTEGKRPEERVDIISNPCCCYR